MIAPPSSLDEANARHQAILSGLHDGVLIQDRHGVIEACNASAERMLGLTADQMMGLTSVSPQWRVIREDGSPFPGREHPAQVALQTGQPVRNVVMGVFKPDQSLTWILTNSTPLFDPGGSRPQAVVSSFADITERIAERAALQAANERAALAMASGRIGIWDWDIARNRMTWDTWMYRLYGLEPTNETGAYDLWSEHLHPDDRAAAEQAVADAIAGGKPFDTEFRVVWPDGTHHYLRGTGWVTHDATGRAVRMIGASWDVTAERRLALDLNARVKRQVEAEKAVIAAETAARAAEEWRKAETSLEESRQQIITSARLSVLGTMAGGIAHEINNPLAVIAALADDLKDLAEAGEAGQAAVLRAASRTLHCTDRIGKIVRSLRYLARDGSRDPFARASVQNIVSQTLDLTIERFRQHSVELHAPEIDPDLWLDCREVNVSQILLNLLQNAFDAALEADVEAGGRRWVRLDVATKDDHMIFSVIDSGAGIPPDVRERIMEPFFTTKPVGQGTGLGLSLSTQMAHEHGGQLDLGEWEGHTCFSLRLPRTQEGPPLCN